MQKAHLYEAILLVNRGVDEAVRGLERLKRAKDSQLDPSCFDEELVLFADVETARADANREFFDNFETVVEDDASWAYQFQREYKQKTKDRTTSISISRIPNRGARRKDCHCGLVILPGVKCPTRSGKTKNGRKKNRPRGRKRARGTGEKLAQQRIKGGRRLSLLPRPKGRPANEKGERRGAAVSRSSWQDRGLGRARLRGGDDVHPRPLHGQDGTVLDAPDGPRHRGSGPRRLENRRLQTTETVRAE
jgi:hypothetical protein